MKFFYFIFGLALLISYGSAFGDEINLSDISVGDEVEFVSDLKIGRKDAFSPIESWQANNDTDFAWRSTWCHIYTEKEKPVKAPRGLRAKITSVTRNKGGMSVKHHPWVFTKISLNKGQLIIEITYKMKSWRFYINEGERNQERRDFWKDTLENEWKVYKLNLEDGCGTMFKVVPQEVEVLK